MKEREALRKEFLSHLGFDFLNVEKLKKDASFRTYERIMKDGKSYLCMDAPPEKESLNIYTNVANFLSKNNFSVPEIYNADYENGFALIEDFGNGKYTNLLADQNKFNEDINETRLYEKAIDVLIHMHKINKLPDFPSYDEQLLIKETSLFTEWYVSVLNNSKLPKKMQDEFVLIWKHLLKQIRLFPQVVVHRDYHADNLMWLEDQIGIKKVGLLDFQDAVIGSPVYDIVSLLEDARRDVSPRLAEEMITRYLKAFPQFNRKDFLASYAILGTQRNLKIVGIFTRLAVLHKNPIYLSYLPRVWNHINNDLKHPLLLPLKNWLDKILPNQTKNFVNNIYSNNTASANKKILA